MFHVDTADFRAAGWTIKARPGGQTITMTSPKSTSKLNPLKSSWEFTPSSPERSNSVGAQSKLRPLSKTILTSQSPEDKASMAKTAKGLSTRRGVQEEEDGPSAAFFETRAEQNELASGMQSIYGQILTHMWLMLSCIIKDGSWSCITATLWSQNPFTLSYLLHNRGHSLLHVTVMQVDQVSRHCTDTGAFFSVAIGFALF